MFTPDKLFVKKCINSKVLGDKANNRRDIFLFPAKKLTLLSFSIYKLR